ncbi:MAG: YigZ family protein [Synergistaceae bacterium]
MELGSSVFVAPRKDCDVELTVKRSRFVGSVRTVLSVDEANEFLRSFPVLFPKANHYCWAYRIGHGSSLVEHCSDAGEPAGTAGRPILGSIKRNLLENSLVVVTRFFGGVKLGVRGLIDAYEESAELAISTAGVVTVEVHNFLEFRCGYDFSKTLLSCVRKWGFDEAHFSVEFGVDVAFSVCVPLSLKSFISPELDELCARGFVSSVVWHDDPVLREKWI